MRMQFLRQVTYTTLLDGWVREGQLDEAESVLESMSERGIPANRITYNTLLRGYAIAGDLKVGQSADTCMLSSHIVLITCAVYACARYYLDSDIITDEICS